MTTDKRKSDKHKRKAYYRKCAAASKRHRRDSTAMDKSIPKQLHPGLTGYIVTCNNQERSALIETYRLLNTVLALHSNPKPVVDCTIGEQQDNEHRISSGTKKNSKESLGHEDDDDDDDIYSQLMKENSVVESSHNPGSTNHPKVNPTPFSFYSVKTGVSNCLFILHTPTHVNPSQLVHDIFQRQLSSKLSESRYVMRLIPVAATCHASTSALGHCLKSIWSKFVGVDYAAHRTTTPSTDKNDECPEEMTHAEQTQNSETTQSTATELEITPQLPFGDILHGSKTFCVNFKARNYDRLSRDDAINAIVSAINSLTPEWRVSYSSPAVVISINVFRNVACISLLENFDFYRKYNLAELIQPMEDAKEEPVCLESNKEVPTD